MARQRISVGGAAMLIPNFVFLLPLFCLLAAAPAGAQPDSRAGSGGSAPPPNAATAPATPIQGFVPMSGKERTQWYLRSTAGAAVGGSVLAAGWSTAWRTPQEYPTTWGGFGKRYALSISGVAISNGAEAGLGALWGEDPRYFRKGAGPGTGFGARMNHVLLSAVTATNRDGNRMPAYARYIAIPGSSFLQNDWRPESQSSTNEALLRTLYGFLGRMSANAIREFLPDLRRKKPQSAPATFPPAALPRN
ncbi:MAG: hypothetical protein U5J83_18275 [Bryobacterales bacterium]|nr:hypothetical protein [Bryobacterales bacterium]